MTHTDGPILRDPVLGIMADTVDDLEQVRIANENRLRTLTQAAGAAAGIDPDIARLAALVEQLKDAEHQAILNLQRVMRRHQLGQWAKPIAGLGEKQLARLLAAIGDPYWNDLYERPRTVSELWSYAGYSVVSGKAPQRARGAQANWSDTARMRARLIAESCIKQAASPYREVYDKARAQYELALHNVDCKRCGPKGAPAHPGSELSAGHQHARSLRIVSKTLLKDLWVESKRLHELNFPSGQKGSASHVSGATGDQEGAA